MAYSTLSLPVIGPILGVLDACSMIAYLRGETGGDVVDSILTNPVNTCYAHVVNLMEVYYDFLRVANRHIAEAAIRDLLSAGIRPRRDIGTAFWKDIGALKAAHGIAIGDCFCLALARKISGTVITSDHSEFDPLASTGIYPIEFIR